MNYIRQGVGLYDLLMTTDISATAQALYFLLLNINNRCAWISEFTVANTKICALLNISPTTLRTARDELMKNGLITYGKGQSNRAGLYSITDFEQTHSEHTLNTVCTHSTRNADTLNKLNYTKQKETKQNIYNKKVKKSPLNNFSCEMPDFSEIENIVLERQRNF